MDIEKINPTHKHIPRRHVPECCGSCIYLNVDDGVNCGHYIRSRGQLYATGVFDRCARYSRDLDA